MHVSNLCYSLMPVLLFCFFPVLSLQYRKNVARSQHRFDIMRTSLIERLECSLVTCLTSGFLRTKWHASFITWWHFHQPEHFWVWESRKLGTESKCLKNFVSHEIIVLWYLSPDGLSPCWVMLQVRQEPDDSPTSRRVKRTHQGAHSSNTQLHTKETPSGLWCFSCFCLHLSSICYSFFCLPVAHSQQHPCEIDFIPVLYEFQLLWGEHVTCFPSLIGVSASSSLNQGCIRAMLHMKWDNNGMLINLFCRCGHECVVFLAFKIMIANAKRVFI